LRSRFVHQIEKNTTVKTEFKIDIIWVRLTILNVYTMQDYVADDVVLIWQLMNDMSVNDVDILYVKIMTCSGS
jgi:hypothetical protein